MLVPAGVTAIEAKVARATFNEVVPLIPPEVAVTVVVPAIPLVAIPLVSIVATVVSEDDQSTAFVISAVLASL